MLAEARNEGISGTVGDRALVCSALSAGQQVPVRSGSVCYKRKMLWPDDLSSDSAVRSIGPVEV